jgi:hypothetical protein
VKRRVSAQEELAAVAEGSAIRNAVFDRLSFERADLTG